MRPSAETHLTRAFWRSSRDAGATWSAHSPPTRSTHTRPHRLGPCARRWSKRVRIHYGTISIGQLGNDTKHFIVFLALLFCWMRNKLHNLTLCVVLPLCEKPHLNFSIFHSAKAISGEVRLYWPRTQIVLFSMSRTSVKRSIVIAGVKLASPHNWPKIYYHDSLAWNGMNGWSNDDSFFFPQSTTRSLCPDHASGKTSTPRQTPVSERQRQPLSRPSSVKPARSTDATERPHLARPCWCSWRSRPCFTSSWSCKFGNGKPSFSIRSRKNPIKHKSPPLIDNSIDDKVKKNKKWTRV